ncbi:MAG TPA: RNase J family beta-CASP ribonuclease [Candidatus Acidoferrales bacterium]|nr:RNase J family beta-CASP ribonuclease [Candidatus Acidoferrales bacterium]
MEVEVNALGGYEEVGRNMTAVRVNGDVVIIDMGIRLDRIAIHEDAEIEKMHPIDLIKMEAIPNDAALSQSRSSVKAIICTHGHLDHIGAVPKLAHRYEAPIISTPFTAELIAQQIRVEKKFGVENPLYTLEAGQIYQITPDIAVEFVRATHSIPDPIIAVLHTPVGALVYANDFKLDRTPVIGKPPDFTRMKSLGKEGVLALIVESTRVREEGKTPSERIAKDLVRDVLLGTEENDKGVLVTTFSSHIARVKTIFEAAEEMDRRPLILGRSMERYLGTAERMGYVELPNDIGIYGNKRSVDKMLRRVIEEGKEKYLPIITGHQGENESTLTRIAGEQTPYQITPGDKIVFSAEVIPTPINAANRYALETKLKMRGARLYTNVHVSGHAAREDHWELIKILKPSHIFPTHGDLTMTSSYVELAEEAGYSLRDNIHLLRNGQNISVGP